jgi:hypothetical protein
LQNGHGCKMLLQRYCGRAFYIEDTTHVIEFFLTLWATMQQNLLAMTVS